MPPSRIITFSRKRTSSLFSGVLLHPENMNRRIINSLLRFSFFIPLAGLLKKEAFMRLTLLGSSLFLLVNSLVYGNEVQNQDILDHLCKEAQSSIERVEHGKVFLRSENLWLNQGQIFVMGEQGNAIRLPYLFSDDNGPYLMKDKRTTIYICSNCTKAYYNYKPDRCEQCWGTNFLVRFQ